ncbi:MAG: 7-cyano-7-deazaguanine reductase [Desulforhopalus sp.]|jgi:7-cyano-7-deazaguanine reductase
MHSNIPLGKEVSYISTYTPDLLFPVPRKLNREVLGFCDELPFTGIDIWNAYEISWLESGGKPRVAIAEIIVSADSVNIIESKSLKLYLNSFNQTHFSSPAEVARVIRDDLEKVAQGEVQITFTLPDAFQNYRFSELEGLCLDDLEIETDCYTINATTLVCEDTRIQECVYSNLLRSNCPVTGQPDWGTVIVHYTGKAISHKGLLRYIISFREHTGFHENCVEQIFADLMEHCAPDNLSVYARFTRRGGLDINPFRATKGAMSSPANLRTARQ